MPVAVREVATTHRLRDRLSGAWDITELGDVLGAVLEVAVLPGAGGLAQDGERLLHADPLGAVRVIHGTADQLGHRQAGALGLGLQSLVLPVGQRDLRAMAH